MNQLPEDLLLSFEQYGAMQKLHIQSLETENNPDMAKFNFERSMAFEELKNRLSLMLKMIKTGNCDVLQIALACHDRLSLIMERDDLLAKLIGKYRDILEQQRQQLCHGKKALKGYGQSMI